MSKRYYACVYGGASDKIADIHKEKTEKLGRLIVDNDFSLVYGAGATGCMGAVARGVDENGGYIMGISPHFISTFEDIYNCDNTIMVDTMSERKTLMEKHADIFFIAPGGVGTMDEFFQVLTLRYLERIDAPIIVVNTEGFYNSLIKLIDDLVSFGAATDRIYNLFQVIDDVDEDEIKNILQKIK
ncbi:MAG: TIGR00730 family Rossman fold protein [Clostridia bacterium]|nr:TIGR00730 family Rossman fold protein [Clostridia bacterium]